MAEASNRPGSTSSFRAIPSVDALLADPRLRAASLLSDASFVAAVRQALEGARAAIAAGAALDRDTIVQRVLTELESFARPSLMPILNGTGVIIHTNLGRAPVSPATAAAMAAVAAGNVALEVEPESGRRGGRGREVTCLMRLLTGAEATLVVNNNAAAVLLTLAAVGAGREVVVSRGEAVEIGGGFRIPDVMRQSGSTLVEVGTTNRTYARDYAQAVTDQTAAFLKVHPSNFSVVGFIASASVAELAELGATHRVPVIEDLGSGALLDTREFGLGSEPTMADSLAAGASVVTASGDKLLGGPQAGIIAGKRSLIDQIAAHPLARAVRADKTCLVGIAMTLRHYARGDATQEIPVWRMISAQVAEIRARAEALASRLASRRLEIAMVQVESTVGGGSLPGQTLPSIALAVASRDESPDSRARRLRLGQTPVYGRVEDGRVLIDLRTILPEDDARLLAAIANVGSA